MSFTKSLEKTISTADHLGRSQRRLKARQYRESLRPLATRPRKLVQGMSNAEFAGFAKSNPADPHIKIEKMRRAHRGKRS